MYRSDVLGENFLASGAEERLSRELCRNRLHGCALLLRGGRCVEILTGRGT